MSPSIKQSVFISYCHKDGGELANNIVSLFKHLGLEDTLVIDSISIENYDSISAHMKKIKHVNRIVFLITDGFLQSLNCMFEMIESLKVDHIQEQIIPIVKTSIYKEEERFRIKEYWTQKKEFLQNRLDNSTIPARQSSDSLETLNKYEEILSNIDNFFKIVVDTKSPSIQELEEKNFSPIFEKLGYCTDEINLFEKIEEIIEIDSYEEQIIELNNLLNIDYPPLYRGWIFNSRGWIHLNQAKFKEAEEDFTSTIDESPEKESAYNNRFVAKKRQGKVIEAIKDIQSAIKLNPTSYSYYYNLALIQAEKGDKELALATYDKVLELNNLCPEAFCNRGLLIFEQGKSCLIKEEKKNLFERAKNDYNKALEINPNLVEAHSNLGLLMSEQNFFEESLTHYSNAITSIPKEDKFHLELDTYLSLLRLKIFLRQGQEAIEILTPLISKYPTEPELEHLKAMAFATKNDRHCLVDLFKAFKHQKEARNKHKRRVNGFL